MKYVIVGGVAAGMSAASKIKRVEKAAVVHVYEKGDTLSYGACGLPYYVAGYNDDPTRLIARSRGAFAAQGIETWLRHEVTRIDTQVKVVTVKNLETGESIHDTYDRLLIATGAAAMRLNIPGADKKGIAYLKTMADGLALKRELSGYGIVNTVVVGGGPAGLEIAEALHALGKHVTCIEADERVLHPYDREFARMAAEELAAHGVQLKTGEQVRAFCGGGSSVSTVRTDKGEYPAELVVVAAGIRPETDFLKETGVLMQPNGAIIADRQMRTSIADVFAAGDCATVYHRLKQKNVYLPLGTAANKCGRIAGGNMCGAHEEYAGTLGSAAIKVFSLEFGRTGLGEKEAMELGFQTGSVLVEARNHPAYYPNSLPLTVKVIYERPSMRLLGAQLAGRDGAALRTDIFATAIQAGMTAKQLGMADLVYAPPFAGVWDAVQVACNAAK